MPKFESPFSGNNIPNKLSEEELIRAMRFAVAAEYEAIQLYKQIADASDNELAKRVLEDVAKEEIVHAGEFLKVIEKLSPEEFKLYNDGAKEVEEIKYNMKCISKNLKTIIKKL